MDSEENEKSTHSPKQAFPADIANIRMIIKMSM
jgi:hypothetical protein